MSVPRWDGAPAIAWVPLRPRASRLGWTAYLTSRGRRFRHHHAAVHTDRGENHDPTGALITAQALNGGLDYPDRNKRTVPSRDTLKKAENATVIYIKLLIFHNLESAAWNFSVSP